MMEDFYEFIRDNRIPHTGMTTEIECPGCGKIRVMNLNIEDEDVECPKCKKYLEQDESGNWKYWTE